MSGYKLTVRTGAKVRKHRHERMDEALAELRRIGAELAAPPAPAPSGAG